MHVSPVTTGEYILRHPLLLGFFKTYPVCSVCVEVTHIALAVSMRSCDMIKALFFFFSRTFDSTYEYRHIGDGPIKIPVLLQFSATTGKPNHAWGGEFFYLPHGLTIDHEGRFWVTDVAMHQVFRFDSVDDTEPSLTLGTRFMHGDSLENFCQPASVAVERSGTIYVADG